MMTVTEQLLRLPAMESQLRAKKKRLEYLREISCGVGAQVITGLPRNPSPPPSRMADAVCSAIDLEKEIAQDAGALSDIKARLTESLSALSETEQDVVIERHLHYLSWEKMSERMGYSSRRLQQINKQALQVLSEKSFV